MQPLSGFGGRITSLWALFLLQSACAAFFLFDAVADLLGHEKSGAMENDSFEFLVVLALIISLIFTALEIRRAHWRQKRMADQIKAASGAFSDLLDEHFEAWALTPSERDVALLAIKGLAISEIAEMRTTKEGTVKAQCNAIYRKAGVSGRPQLLSLFIEELMTGDALIAE